MVFFHVGAVGLLPPTLLHPGKWDLMMQRWVVGKLPNAEDGKTLTWEISLEMARVTYTPAAPSRLNCVFATLDIGAARAFRDEFRSGYSIYEARPRQELQFTLRILPCSERGMQSELLT